MKNTLRLMLLRYLGAVGLISAAGLVSDLSSLFIVIPVAFVSLKFLVYEAIVSVVKAAGPSFQTKPWFYVGYGLAVAGDMFFVWGANRDQVDAGFAFLGTLVVTPWVLVGAFVVMLVATIRHHRSKRSRIAG